MTDDEPRPQLDDEPDLDAPKRPRRPDRVIADDGRLIDPSRQPGAGNPFRYKPRFQG